MRRVRFARATLRHQPSIVSYVVKDGLLAGWYLRGCLVSSPIYPPLRPRKERNACLSCTGCRLELVYDVGRRRGAHTVAYMIQGNVGNRSDTGPCHARVRCVSCVSRLPRCLFTGTLIFADRMKRRETSKSTSTNHMPQLIELVDAETAEPRADLGKLGDVKVDENGTRRFTSLRSFLCTPFCMGQLIFNIVCNFLGPFCLYIVVFLNAGPERWNGKPMMGIMLTGPFVSALLGLTWLPLGIPEAAAKGWFGIVEPESVPCLLRALPFLLWRRSVLRHLGVGFVAFCIWSPTVLVLDRFVAALEQDGPQAMSAQAFVVFAPTCIAFMALITIPLGLLGFAMPDNYARVEGVMAITVREAFLKRFWRRMFLAPTC